MDSLLTHICVSRPQWVKPLAMGTSAVKNCNISESFLHMVSSDFAYLARGPWDAIFNFCCHSDCWNACVGFYAWESSWKQRSIPLDGIRNILYLNFAHTRFACMLWMWSMNLFNCYGLLYRNPNWNLTKESCMGYAYDSSYFRKLIACASRFWGIVITVWVGFRCRGLITPSTACAWVYIWSAQ